MLKVIKKLHLYSAWRAVCIFCINHVFKGLGTISVASKRRLMKAMGFPVGNGTTIVSPIGPILGNVKIGDNCWINRGLTIHGNGYVQIGDNCDLGPDIVFLTGGHEIGTHERRAGKGQKYTISVENGCWIGAKTTILGDTTIGSGTVVAACACVICDIDSDVMAAGVPARIKRGLEDGKIKTSIPQ